MLLSYIESSKPFKIPVLWSTIEQRVEHADCFKDTAAEGPGLGLLAQPPYTFDRLQPRPEGSYSLAAWTGSGPRSGAVGRVLQPGVCIAVDRTFRRGAQRKCASGRGSTLPHHVDARGHRYCVRLPVLPAHWRHARLPRYHPVAPVVR